MDTLRALVTVVVWVTVAGGLLMAVLWLRAGGARAFGPEDEFVEAAASAGHTPAGRTPTGATSGAAARVRRVTSISTSNIALHALLGVLTATLVTYAAGRDTDRATGYAAALVAVGLTAMAGSYMFVKWSRGWRPRAEGVPVAGERAEDHLPVAVVFLHGLAALTVAGLLIALLVEAS